MSETTLDTNSMIKGKVNNVMTLLSAVSVTDNATSPFASIEKTFDELPPGQQATSTSPIKYAGGNLSTQATVKANKGSRIICPDRPNSTALGFRATSVNAVFFKLMPNRNIRTMRIGITIHIVFIELSFEVAKIPFPHDIFKLWFGVICA